MCGKKSFTAWLTAAPFIFRPLLVCLNLSSTPPTGSKQLPRDTRHTSIRRRVGCRSYFYINPPSLHVLFVYCLVENKGNMFSMHAPPPSCFAVVCSPNARQLSSRGHLFAKPAPLL